MPIAYCLLPIAYCLLPIAYCLLSIAYCLLPIAYCLLPIAYCLLPIVLKAKGGNSKGFGKGGQQQGGWVFVPATPTWGGKGKSE